ncbi:MAG: Na+/H+ antiporter NhaA [Gammaproteobacteria bacterium]
MKRTNGKGQRSLSMSRRATPVSIGCPSMTSRGCVACASIIRTLAYFMQKPGRGSPYDPGRQRPVCDRREHSPGRGQGLHPAAAVGKLVRDAGGAAGPAAMGFTMSMFIANLSFGPDLEQLLAAKSAIMLSSLLAGFAGFTSLWLAGTSGARRENGIRKR